jgi:hypothetical protein
MGPGPPGWGLGLRLMTLSRKNSIVEKLHKMKSGIEATLDWTYEDAGRNPSKETYLNKTRGKYTSRQI